MSHNALFCRTTQEYTVIVRMTEMWAVDGGGWAESWTKPACVYVSLLIYDDIASRMETCQYSAGGDWDNKVEAQKIENRCQCTAPESEESKSTLADLRKISVQWKSLCDRGEPVHRLQLASEGTASPIYLSVRRMRTRLLIKNVKPYQCATVRNHFFVYIELLSMFSKLLSAVYEVYQIASCNVVVRVKYERK